MPTDQPDGTSSSADIPAFQLCQGQTRCEEFSTCFDHHQHWFDARPDKVVVSKENYLFT